jgi:outer membrane protein OmpA-like peptidoglycan-associated protein
VELDLPGGKKTLAGRVIHDDFVLADSHQVAVTFVVRDNYINARQGVGAKLISNPDDISQAVLTRQTPQGEFCYIYHETSGNEKSIGAYTLTSVQVGGPPLAMCKLEVYGVNFDFDKATLRPESDAVPTQVLGLFTGDAAYATEISGHTDNVGQHAYNIQLSGKRAAVVKDWPVAHGVAATRMRTAGYGDTRPLVPNTSDENRFRNRRVELKRVGCKQ